jgi:hypothetical protein
LWRRGTRDGRDLLHDLQHFLPVLCLPIVEARPASSALQP